MVTPIDELYGAYKDHEKLAELVSESDPENFPDTRAGYIESIRAEARSWDKELDTSLDQINARDPMLDAQLDNLTKDMIMNARFTFSRSRWDKELKEKYGKPLTDDEFRSLTQDGYPQFGDFKSTQMDFSLHGWGRRDNPFADKYSVGSVDDAAAQSEQDQKMHEREGWADPFGEFDRTNGNSTAISSDQGAYRDDGPGQAIDLDDSENSDDGGSQGGLGGGLCFVAGTPVLTPAGEKPIETLKVGDMVMAFDGFGELTPRRIVACMKREQQVVIEAHGVRMTPGHRFFNGRGEFVAIRDFANGDCLVSAGGELVPFEGIADVIDKHTVYNITVEDLHTYVAGSYRVHNIKPIVLDLDGDGIELKSIDDSTAIDDANSNTAEHFSTAFFDYDNDGYVEHVGWTAADDGMLVVDLDGDGTVNQTEELVIAAQTEEADTDLEALRTLYDSNGDDVFDANDDAWDEFYVWQDLDQDGKSDDGELHTLDELGITSIDLAGTPVPEDEQDVLGNKILNKTSYTKSDGTTGEVGDVVFDASPEGIRFDDDAGGVTFSFEGAEGSILFGQRNAKLDLDASLANKAAVFAGSGDDILITTGSAAVVMDGGAGDDLIRGGDGADWLGGGEGADDISAGAGNDLLVVDAADTQIDGGDGFDIALVAGTESISLDLAASHLEAVASGEGNDILDASQITVSEDEDAADKGVVIDGGAGNDTISGGAGDDLLAGGEGADTITGGAGNDQLIVDGQDTFDGGEGVDSVFYTGDEDLTLNISDKNVEIFFSGDGNDVISTDDENTASIYGAGGNDTLSGGWGGDWLAGGTGDDVLKGGYGDDTYQFNRGDGTATIEDFYSQESTAYEYGGTVAADQRWWQADLQDAIRASLQYRGYSGRYTPNFGDSSYDYSYGGYYFDYQYTGTRVGGPDDSVTFTEYYYNVYKKASFTDEVDAGADTLSLGAGLSAADLMLRYDGSTLEVGLKDPEQPGQSFDELSDKISLVDWNLTKRRVETLKMANGTLVNIAAVMAAYGVPSDGTAVDLGSAMAAVASEITDATVIAGTGESESLGGTSGDDHLLGQAGDDTLFASGGTDVHDGGAGSDTVDYSKLAFAADVNLSSGLGKARVDSESVQNQGDGSGNDTLISIENATGTAYSDILTGDDQANTLAGGSGNDTLVGGAGNDSLLGGSGHDLLEGGAGADTLTGGDGEDMASYESSTAGVTVSLASGTGSGGDAQGDVLSKIEDLKGSEHADSLTGDAEDNWLTGLGGDDTLAGGDGADTLYGGDGSDQLSGGLGDDTLLGDAGADNLDGGDGVDAASYLGSEEAVSVNLASGAASGGHAEGDSLTSIENLTGSHYDDMLVGDSGANTIRGAGGSDHIDGAAGDDVLDGGAGVDLINGGSGNDTVTYELAGEGALAMLENIAGDKMADQFNYQRGEEDILQNVENVIGSDYDDTILGSHAANSLTGGAGDDQIFGADGADTLDGGDGRDLLIGGAGADTLTGGAGYDTASYAKSDAAVTVDLAAGTGVGGDAEGDILVEVENVVGSDHADTLSGDDNFNRLEGGLGNDTLNGGAGNDTLVGGLGADVLIGGDGLDTASYEDSDAAVSIDLGLGTASGGTAEGDTYAGIEHIVGSDYTDTLTGGAGDDSFDGGASADMISGSTGADTLYGGAGNDSLHGGEDNDILSGGADDDSLQGDAGDDMLSGGSGLDKAIYAGNRADYAVEDNGDGSFTVRDLKTADGDDGSDTVSGVEELVFADGSLSLEGQYGPEPENMSIVVDAVQPFVGQLKAIDADGDALAFELVDGPANGTVTINADGTYSFQANTEFSGPDSFTYRVKDADGLSQDAIVEIFVSGPPTGANILESGVEADTLTGGAGIDLVSYADSTARVKANLQTGDFLEGYAEGDIVSNVDGIIGSEYNDNLKPSETGSILIGGGGYDYIFGGAGVDYLDGGSGTNWLQYSYSDSGVTVNLATETVSGGDAEGDTIHNFIYVAGSNDWADTLIGDDQDNRMRGRGGADTMDGGAGTDMLDYYFSSAGVTINLTTGEASGGDAEGDVFTGFESVIGSDHNDSLTGDFGKNELNGWQGDDTLYGLGGDDKLVGWQGDDMIDGGDGHDQAVYRGNRADYAVENNGNGSWTVRDLNTADGDDGSDTVSGVEELVFADGSLNLDGQHGPQAEGGKIVVDGSEVVSHKLHGVDADGDVLTFELVDGPANGTVTVNADGTYSFQANAGFTGDDSFSYRVTDENGLSKEAVMQVTHIPEAVDVAMDETRTSSGTSKVAEDQSTTTAMIFSDGDRVLDANGGAGVWSSVALNDTISSGKYYFCLKNLTALSAGEWFNVTLQSTGSLYARPNASQDTMFSFHSAQTYAGGDFNSQNDVAMIAIDMDEGKAWIGQNGVWNGAGNPGAGTAPDFLFTPEEAMIAIGVYQDAATVELIVDEQDYPYGAPSGFLPLGNSDVPVGTEGNDALNGDAYSNTLTGLGGDDLLRGNAGNDVIDGGSGDDQAVYAGNRADYAVEDNGNGSWTVRDLNTADGDDGSDTVSGVEELVFADGSLSLDSQHGPQAEGGKIVVDGSEVVSHKLHGVDADGDVLTFELVDGPANGTVTVNADGTYSFQANSGFTGNDSFTYRVTDENGLSAESIVSIENKATPEGEVSIEDVGAKVAVNASFNSNITAKNGLAFGDINGDGLIDLVMLDYEPYSGGTVSEAAVKALYGTADGSFGSAGGIRNFDDASDVDYELRPSGTKYNEWMTVAVGDFSNRPGDEIVYSHSSYQTGMSIVGSDPEAVSEADITAPVPGGVSQGVLSQVVADFNGDGHDDLFVGAKGSSSDGYSSTNRTFFGWLADANGTVSGSHTVSAYTGVAGVGNASKYMSALAIGAADINGDGYDDIVTTGGGSNDGYYQAIDVKVTYGNGAGTFNQSLNSSTGGFIVTNTGSKYYNRFIANGRGDINGDGIEDLAFYNSTQTAVRILFGNAGLSGTVDIVSQAGLTISNAGGDVSSVAWGDLNGDGFSDLVIGVDSANGGNGNLWFVWGQQGGWQNGTVDLSAGGNDAFLVRGTAGQGLGNEVAVLDTNNDGRDDVVVGSSGENGDLYVLDGKLLTRPSLEGTSGNDVLNGDGYSNTLTGLGGDDMLRGNAGDDVIDGGSGDDQAVYAGNRADYAVEDNGNGSWTVRDLNTADGDDGSDTVSGVEELVFADGSLSLDSQHGPQAEGGKIVVDGSEVVSHKLHGVDADGDVLTFELVDGPANGTVTVNADGTYSFQANAGFTGADSFSYRVTDENGLFKEAVMTVEHSAVDTGFEAPVNAYPGYGPTSGGWTSQNSYPRQVADVNGDGRADIVGFSSGGLKVALGQEDGTFGAAQNRGLAFITGWGSWDQHYRTLADVNGDGRADIVGFADQGVYVAQGQSDGSFGSVELAYSGYGPTSGGWTSQNAYPRQVADVNGDGRADIVGFSSGGLKVALGQEDGTFGAAQNRGLAFITGWGSWDQHYRTLADVNGDGRADIVGFADDGVYVAQGQSDGSFGSANLAYPSYGPTSGGWISQNTYPRQVADVNGDGRADIVGFASNGLFVSLGNEDGTFGSTQNLGMDFITNWGSWDQHYRTLADVNGDGRADIVGFADDGVKVALANSATAEEGTDGNDVLVGLDGADSLVGGSGDDLLQGNAGDDYLSGGNGNDTLVGGAGDDLLNGGEGQDEAVFSGQRSDYQITDNGDGTTTVTDLNTADGDDGSDVLSGVEAMIFADGTDTVGQNDTPVVVGTISASTVEDTTLTLMAADLLANASDIDGDALSIVNLQVSGGTVVDNGDGTWTFTPAADFNGDVALSYEVSDGTVTVPATGVITVTPVADNASIAGDKDGSVKEDVVASVTGVLTVSDPDAGEAGMQAQTGVAGSYGTFSIDANGNWNYVLTDNNAVGIQALGDSDSLTETFSVTSLDGTATETVTVTIEGTNGAPVVSGPVAASTGPAKAVTVTAAQLLANASDEEGDLLSVSNLASSNADVTIIDNGDGTWTLTPATGVSGDVALTFDVSDGKAATVGSLTLTVEQGTVRLGTAGDDVFDFPSIYNNEDSLIDGQGGYDKISVGYHGYFDQVDLQSIELIEGNNIGNTISGSAGSDTIAGRGGDDMLKGNGGDDVFLVGDNEGWDRISGGEGNDTILGTDNDETITLYEFIGDNRTEVIDGGAGNNTLYIRYHADFTDTELRNIDLIKGGSIANQITGSVGNDRIMGGTNNDILKGGLGDDIFIVGNDQGLDRISGGEGTDTILGTDGDDLMTLYYFTGDERVEIIDGGLGTNTLSVQYNGDFSQTTIQNIDRIKGSGIANTLIGSQGDDVLDGFTNNDTLTGGAGNDTFVFASGYGTDKVTDAEAADKVAFEGGLASSDVWFTQSGDNLVARLYGSSDAMVIEDWYDANAAKQVGGFTLDNGKTLSAANVQSLVDAMASFSVSDIANGLVDTNSAAYANVQSTIAASWQSN